MKKITILIIALLLLLSGCNKEDNQGENSLPKKVKIGIIRVPNDTSVAMSENTLTSFLKIGV